MTAGIEDIFGLDGEYVDQDRLLFPRDKFRATDLTKPFDLGRRFDLVQSLEVAEHLPVAAADGYVASLVRHGPLVLFSAAPPGQGGEHHVNEQPPSYWREKFARHDYRPVDFLRSRIAGEKEIAPWYRYNLLFYVHRDTFDSLSGDVGAAALADNQPIANVAPLSYRVRCRMISLLPTPLQQVLALAAKKVRTYT
jgi:hypothetical protein